MSTTPTRPTPPTPTKLAQILDCCPCGLGCAIVTCGYPGCNRAAYECEPDVIEIDLADSRWDCPEHRIG